MMKTIRCLIVLFLVLVFPNCATIYRPPPKGPLNPHEIRIIMSGIEEQGRKVFAFYTVGSLLVKDWAQESESNILIAGTKGPFKIKIEITHPWGRPILHILFHKTRLEVLSFSDKKFYLGTFTPEALSKIFPGELNANLLWATLRGYPNLITHHRIASRKANQVTLFDGKGKAVEVIDVYPESLLPKSVSFPEQHIDLAFSRFQKNNDIYYAREVQVKSTKRRKNLTLKNRKMVFNKAIPGEVFTLEKPPAFEILDLDTYGSGAHQ